MEEGFHRLHGTEGLAFSRQTPKAKIAVKPRKIVTIMAT
jgi:hypothetical protein